MFHAVVEVVTVVAVVKVVPEGRKEFGFTSLSTAYVISRRDRNQEPGRNSLLFTNISKGSLSCRRTIDSPPQSRTFI